MIFGPCPYRSCPPSSSEDCRTRGENTTASKPIYSRDGALPAPACETKTVFQEYLPLIQRADGPTLIRPHRHSGKNGGGSAREPPSSDFGLPFRRDVRKGCALRPFASAQEPPQGGGTAEEEVTAATGDETNCRGPPSRSTLIGSAPAGYRGPHLEHESRDC